MKIRFFSLNLTTEVIVKVSREVLTLFHIEETDTSPDYESLAVHHEVSETMPLQVRTEISLYSLDGTVQRSSTTSSMRVDENPSTALHRLAKLHLYNLLRDLLGFAPAPWGILYGVRPTKIVHQYMARENSRQEIQKRLSDDFAVSEEKATLLCEIAEYQKPFLATSGSHDVSIYVGIPFCLSRCLYCSFPANVLPKASKLQAFMEVFQRDLLAAKRDLDAFGLRVQNIYLGGGTPTSLPDARFAEMMSLVYANFYHDDIVEFTVEAGRPDSMSPSKMQTMLNYNVNRVCVNPQTMQARTLKRIGRNHTPDDILRMYEDLRKAGIQQINMDMILGLPGETASDVEDSVQRVSALCPDDITLHTLALKKGSRLKLQLSDTELPDDAEVRRMFNVAVDLIKNHGMLPYYLYRQGYQSGQLENIGFCRPGAESMYNIQIMDEHQTILGIGAAATSKIIHPMTKRMQATFHPKDLITYLKNIDVYTDKRTALLQEAYAK